MGIPAALHRLRERRELQHARRAADSELIGTTLPPPRLAWRTNELVTAERRRELAQALAEVVHGSDTRYLPGASPLNRVAARQEVDIILRLAARLADLEKPVRPRGVLLVEQLLDGGASPLYAREHARLLHRALDEALAALDGPR